MTSIARLTLSGISKTFGRSTVLENVDLDIEGGKFLVLLGSSGCGKSTLLNIIAGLETPSTGRIAIGGRDVTELNPGERDIAMVFQSYALYPGMSAGQNIGFGLKMRGVSSFDVASKVKGMAQLLQIEHLLHRKPAQLSGGEQQRVAIGRALVRHPAVLLFDEPLSNLDARLRGDMRAELKRLHAERPCTTMYVTHDQTEAMTLADTLAVMNDGKIVQWGAPADIYARPADRFVAAMVGSPAMNFFRGKLVQNEGRYGIESSQKILPLPGLNVAPSVKLGLEVVAGFRPEHVRLVAQGGQDSVPARTRLVESTGADSYVRVDVLGREVILRAPVQCPLRYGDPVEVAIEGGSTNLFSIEDGKRLN